MEDNKLPIILQDCMRLNSNVISQEGPFLLFLIANNIDKFLDCILQGVQCDSWLAIIIRYMEVTFNNDFKLINWDTYFRFFETSIVDSFISNKENHFLFLFLQGYTKELGSKNTQLSLQYYLKGEKEFDPFCTYRLAQIYNSPNNFNLIIQPNKEKSWFYVLKTSVINSLKYNTDFFNAKQKIMTIMAKNGVVMQTCYELIQKYEHKQTVMIMRYCFILVYGREQDKSNMYMHLMKEFQNLFKNQQGWFMWQFLFGFMSSDIEIKNKDFDTFKEIVYKNSENLSKFVEIYSHQLEIILKFPVDDNLIISKMRDYMKLLIIIVKMFKFGHQYKDKFIQVIQKNLLTSIKLIYQSLIKVRILQDRTFFTFHYCQLLFKINTSHQVVVSLLSELESMIMIKSQLGFLGFFYYLKNKVKPDNQTLQISRTTFQKETLQNQSQNGVIVHYYLGKIYKKMEDYQKYKKQMQKGYELYQLNRKKWSDTTLKGYYTYSSIRRHLKKMGYLLKNNLQLKVPIYYSSASQKTHLEHIQKQDQQVYTQFKFSDINILDILKIQPFKFYIATLKGRLATIQKLSFLNDSEMQSIQKQISQFSLIQNIQIIPIITTISQQLLSEQEKYYNLYVVYPPCFLYCPKGFQESIEECWKLSKARDHICRKVGEINTPIKVYSAKRQPGLLGYIGKKDPQCENTFNGEIFGKVVKEYPFQFMNRNLNVLKQDKITEFLEQIFLNI